MTDRTLIIVDVQEDFVEGGSLAVTGGRAVATKITDYLMNNAGRYARVITTRDWHDPDTSNGGHFSDQPDYAGTWPEHCVAGTHGARFAKEFPLGHLFPSVRKGQGAPAYSGFEGTTKSGERLTDLIPRGSLVDVIGIATDYCVKATALDALKAGYTTRVLPDLCAAVAEETGKKALDELAGAGVEVIGSNWAFGNPMTFSYYQSSAAKTAIYPERDTSSPLAMAYVVLGVVNEVGEVCEKIAYDGVPDEIAGEAGDVLWYLAQTCTELRYSLSDITDDATSEGKVETFRKEMAVEAPESAVRAALLLSAAAGKLAGHVKKAIRDDGAGTPLIPFGTARHLGLVSSIAEALQRLDDLAMTTGVPLATIAMNNLDKLSSRASRGVIGGAGDHR